MPRHPEAQPATAGEIAITIPVVAWQDAGAGADPRARLLARVWINGCPMHVEAYRVTVSAAGVQEAADPENAEAIDRMYEAVDGSGPWLTVTIGGHRYVVIATPHCD